MTLVVDASSIVPLALEEDRDYAESVLLRIGADGVAFTAPIFFDEVRNVLLVAERRGRSTAEANDRFLQRLASVLPLDTSRMVDRDLAMDLARRTGLTFYDATYLAMAVQTGSDLATADRELIRAAGPEGVAVFAAG